MEAWLDPALFSLQVDPTPRGAIPHVSQVFVHINRQSYAILLAYIMFPHGSHFVHHPLGPVDWSLARNLEALSDGERGLGRHNSLQGSCLK